MLNGPQFSQVYSLLFQLNGVLHSKNRALLDCGCIIGGIELDTAIQVLVTKGNFVRITNLCRSNPMSASGCPLSLVRRAAKVGEEPKPTKTLQRGEGPLFAPPRQFSIERRGRHTDLICDGDPFSLLRFTLKVQPSVKAVCNPP